MDTSNRTFVSSILFLDIVEYSRQSVTDQMTLKQRFNDLLVDALKHVAPSDRIVLDTGDGAAVSFQGNPEDSLFAAMHLRDALAAAPSDLLPRLDVRFGINLGPVRLIKDINGQFNIIGDGINVAQRVMSFADAGIILVSRSYYEVVSRLSDDYAKIFQDAGTRTDKHVREHAVYAIGKSLDSIAATPRIPAATFMVSPDTDNLSGSDIAGHAPASNKTLKRVLLGSAAILGMITVVIGVRSGQEGETHNNSGISEPPKTGSPSPMAAARPSVSNSATSTGTAKKHEGKPPVIAAVQPAKPAKSPVLLTINPWGEVYVDGKKKGASPPLKSLSVTPGKHTIEIRNTTFPSFVTIIDAKPGIETRISHKF